LLQRGGLQLADALAADAEFGGGAVVDAPAGVKVLEVRISRQRIGTTKWLVRS